MALGYYTGRYAALGAAFGFSFPLGSTIVQALIEHGSAGLDALIAIQVGSPLLWVIDSAPIWLGLFAAVAGRRQDALNDAMSALEKANTELETAMTTLEESNSNLEQANLELVEASQLKSQFLANMSHELRTPLNAIIGFSRIVLRKTKDLLPERQAKNLKMVHESGQHLLEMVNDLLDIERIEAGMLNVSVSEVDAAEMVRDVAARLRPTASDKNLTVAGEVDVKYLRLMTDPVRLRQILDNLVNNAIKYSDDGHIVLRASIHPSEEAPEEVRFAIKDEGKGIPADQLAVIFDPFHQVDGTSTRAEGGVGLGLHLVRRLAEILDGMVSVTSTLGEGSTFTLTLPADKLIEGEELETSDASSDAPEPMGEGPLLLVVEDDAKALELLQNELAGHGFRVHAARTGADGLEKAAALHPDAILLDMILPDVDGWTVLKRLRASPTTAAIPVVVTSSLDEEVKAMDLGVVSWLTKPVAAEVLGELLRTMGVGKNDDVLVVEDDAPTRSLVLQGLHGLGLSVRTAADGPSAIEAIDDRLPRILVLDLMLPHIDGFDVLAHLRERPNGDTVPVVVYTAKDLSAEERKRLNGGVVEVIGKGGGESLSGVVKCIRRAMARREEVDAKSDS